MSKSINIEPKTKFGWSIVLVISMLLVFSGLMALADRNLIAFMFYGVPGGLGVTKSIMAIAKLPSK